MASLIGLVQDQKVDFQYNASAGLKSKATKAPRKGGAELNGRKALGDLSSSHSQRLKKQNAGILSVTQSKTGTLQNAPDFSKKNTSKASSSTQGGTRRALSDISNSRKPQVHEASKKSLNTKLSFLAEGIGEQFVHNHQECIEDQTRHMKLNQFLQIIGLVDDAVRPLAAPRKHPMPSTVESLPIDLQEESMAEYLPIQEHFFAYKPSSKFGLSPPSKTPRSSTHYVQWNEDYECINFKLIATPKLLKH